MSNPDGPRTGRPPTLASNGMVSTPHYLASASGLAVLRRGGSAVDAAIAAGATLCVVYPHMTGLGGDGFWLIAGGETDGVQALNASGPSARAATTDYYRQRGCVDSIPERGPLAALTVPGVVDGWREAHERYGRLPWAELFADAITYAREGIPIGRSLADWLSKDESILQKDPEMARIYLPEGGAQREGARLVQSELADSIEEVATRGARAGFYEGPLADRISAGLEAAGSPLRAEDFEAYQAEWVEPISTRYRGYDVVQMPPNTQGFAALQILNLLERFDVAAWGEGSVEYYHYMVEAAKVAFADRDEWLTDPEFVDIPLERMLSPGYTSRRLELVDATHTLTPEAVEPGLHHNGARSAHPAPRGGTVYFCVADSDGLVVSAIESIYHDFGAAIIGGDTGIILQNRGSFFELDEDHPNRLEPGKLSFHTIIPALMLREADPVLAYGAMGGEGQPQTQAALVTRLVDFGFDVQQAIEAPRWLMGRTWGTETRTLSLESRISDEITRELELRGHPVQIVSAWDQAMGHAQAIRVLGESGFFEGGADPRGEGAAVGY